MNDKHKGGEKIELSMMCKPGEEPLAYRYWSRCEEVAIHFNDLCIKFRLQALAGLAIAGAIVSAGVKATAASSWAMVGGGLAMLAVLWVGVALIDFLYYGRLLRGAVAELERVEGRFGEGSVQLSTKIEAETWGRKGPFWGRFFFYALPFLAMSFGSYMSYCSYSARV